MIAYQYLDWDTQQLGLQVAKLIPAQTTSDALQASLHKLQAEGLQLVYWCSDREDAATQKAAQDCKGILVDEKITYTLGLPSQISLPAQVTPYHSEIVSPELLQLAYDIGHESRFYLDPKMPREGYKKIYQAWIENTVQHRVADEIFVTQEKERITGFVSLIDKGSYGNIALIAVDAAHRGKGLATQLLTAAKHWCTTKQHTHCEVVTQKTNTAACHVYEKNGFSVDKIEHFYHFWLDTTGASA